MAVYTKNEFVQDVQSIEKADIACNGICCVDDIPEAFDPLQFSLYIDAFISNEGIVEYLRSGMYQQYANTMNSVLNAYDFDDHYAVEELKQTESYQFQTLYREWYLVNDQVDLIDPENMEDATRACEVFNRIRGQVCSMSIEKAILFSVLTERLHHEVGGMCHDCDTPPLVVDYVIANNKNYTELKIDSTIPELLDLDSKDAVVILKTLHDLKLALEHEIDAVALPEFQF